MGVGVVVVVVVGGLVKVVGMGERGGSFLIYPCARK
jgi:hypothetical protein